MKQKRNHRSARRLIISIAGIMIVQAASIQISFALTVGSPTPVSAAETIPASSLAPANLLQVVDGMQGTDVQILAMGAGVRQTAVLDNNTVINNGAVSGGDWDIASTQRISHYPGYEALAVQFVGSDVSAANYSTDADAGWNPKDLTLDTTTMWIKIKYTNAGYYKGALVDAVATIKVTPYKNRTVGVSWASLNYADQPYYPTIQLSELLYNGWCWQNVGEYNVDLTFYPKGGTTPIEFPATTFSDTSGAYYVLNSLNPARSKNEGPTTVVLTGPEYVWPKSGTVTQAYVADNSNIRLDYNGDTEAGLQYGYNGGTNGWGAPWDASQDNPTSPDWNLNSVMFATANTNHLNFTLGAMERDPYASQQVKRTIYVWTSFSTEAFSGRTVSYIDIPVSKVWVNPASAHPDSVTVDLYQEWTTGDWSNPATIQSEKVQTVELNDSNKWSDTFKYLPAKADLAKKLGVNESQVRYTAKEAAVPGYVPTYTYQENGSIVVSNKEIKPAKAAAVDIQKTVKGSPKTDETFTFELTPDEATFPMPAGSDGKKTAMITGAGTTSFGTWTYTKAGVYTYHVREVAGDNADYKYDATVYEITDTVTLNDNGELVVNRVIQTTAGSKTDGALTFTNQFMPQEEFPSPPENLKTNPPVQTGDASQPYLFLLAAILSLGTITAFGIEAVAQESKMNRQ